MDNAEELKRLENIEFLLASAIENMNRIVEEANDPQKRQKEAEILTQASERLNLLSREISGLVSKEKSLIENFKPEVIVKHNTLDFKQPFWWGVATVLVTIILVLFLGFFIKENKNLKAKNAELTATDMKYRYLKVATFINFNLKKFKNAPELIESMDSYYSRVKGKKDVDSTVFAREKAIYEANEAAELAKQKEAEGKENDIKSKKAIEEAKRLKRHADSLTGY
jgi:hypothetical protein